MKETEDQLDIIKSIRVEGGYAKKWATGYTVGVPDLVCALPEIGNFLMEVKKLSGEGLTMKQRHELQEYSYAGGLSLVAWVVRKNRILICNIIDTKFLLPCPWDKTRSVYTEILSALKIIKGGKEEWMNQISKN